MRLFLFPALAIAFTLSASAADTDTAYKALRVFGKKFGDSTLNGVVEVRGRAGVPQPAVWKITAVSAGSRGGVVEAEVQRGKIISQRQPTSRGGAGQPMDFNRMNLDSDGAFTLANQELQKRDVPFDRVDYLVRMASTGTAPVWRLDLFDGNSKVATMEISADSGAILETQMLRSGSSDRDYVTSGPSQPPRDRGGDREYDRDREYARDRDYARRGDDGYSRPGEKFRGVGDFFHRLGKRFERRGVQIKRFFDDEN